tara:strand:+ start:833 stop:1075 length:243 start_codon:yes stop_codon:yes gene_type:complete
MKPRQALFEAKRFLIHGLATALYSEDRTNLHPKIQEALTRMELFIHHFIQEYKDGHRCTSDIPQGRDSITENSEGDQKTD